MNNNMSLRIPETREFCRHHGMVVEHRVYHMLLVTLVILLSLVSASQAHTNNRIKLVLQITVDGLRADLLNRYGVGFGEGGFRYLMMNGAYFTNAHYQYANTETIVGHTTLSTGTFPSQHGMIGNVWFDRKAGELAYNIEDPEHPLLPTREHETKGEQVDPAQKQSRTQGRSPSAILVPTFSDSLTAYYGGHSKIFSVSGKDRSAVSMSGQTGKAFWYSTNTGDFISSTYYYRKYPDWVKNWNEQRKTEGYSGEIWSLLNSPSTYQLGGQDDRPYESDLKGFGRVFPHPYGQVSDKLLFTKILASPAGDQLALDFSKALIKHEQMGLDDVPDYLSISFSGVDAVNHFFGPSSLENEDTVVQLDRTLADLFNYIDQNIGLKSTLIVLAADHGMADMPEYLTELGYETGRLYPDEIVAVANKVGQQFGIDGVVRFFYRPYIYIDEGKVLEASVDPADVQKAISGALMQYDGIALAAASSRLSEQHADPLWDRVRNNYHSSRSGDIYVVPKPYWFLFDKGPVKAMHGSPWRYDTHVPIIFSGPGINTQKVSRLVHPVDVTPTISAFLGMTPPGSVEGTVLKEIFDQ